MNVDFNNIKTEDIDIWETFDDLKTEFENEEFESEDDENSNSGLLLCFNCEENSLILDKESVVCENCGADNGAIIDYTQEWRFYGENDNKNSDPNRCGMAFNPQLPKSSMGTQILGGKGFRMLRRINTWNAINYKERSLLTVFRKIQNTCYEEDIDTATLDRTKTMYSILSSEALKRGKCKDGLINGCLYNSCNDNKNPKTPKEMLKLSNLSKKKFTDGCKQFKEIMFYANKDYILNLQPITYKDFIRKYTTMLEISYENRDRAIFIADQATELGLVYENSPLSIAVGSIWLVCIYFGVEMTKKNIAETCDISEVTITKICKKMNEYRDLILPPGAMIPPPAKYMDNPVPKRPKKVNKKPRKKYYVKKGRKKKNTTKTENIKTENIKDLKETDNVTKDIHILNFENKERKKDEEKKIQKDIQDFIDIKTEKIEEEEIKEEVKKEVKKEEIKEEVKEEKVKKEEQVEEEEVKKEEEVEEEYEDEKIERTILDDLQKIGIKVIDDHSVSEMESDSESVSKPNDSINISSS